MNQVSPKLRRCTRGYSHWCPACVEVHMVFDSWAFNGNLLLPSFAPSVKITGYKTVRDAQGRWIGGWEHDAKGNLVPECCHYFLTGGMLQYQNDCTHVLNGKMVPLPDLPEWLQDEDFEK